MDSKLYNGAAVTGNFIQSLLLIVIRLYFGFLFFAGGYAKVTNMGPFVGYFQQIGLSTSLAYVVAILELICGILIFFGFLTRLASLVTSVIMISAYVVAHTAEFNSFFSDPSFFLSSKNFPYLFASLVLLFFGPGMISIDAILKRKMIHKDPSN